MKKRISFLLTVALAAGSTIGVYGANFSDINNVPWAGAVTFINEVADAGIMVGSELDGKLVFRAKDSVTLCETTQLVYSLLEKTGYLKSADGLETKWAAVMKGYNIPQWAYKGVSYCLENNIIAADDLKAFMSGTTSAGAKREQVAYIMGRALQTVDGDMASGGAVTFKDATKISTVAIPYVQILNNAGILTGDTDGNFNPTITINRAEMAVVMSKSLKLVEQLKIEEAQANAVAQAGGGTTPGVTVPGTTTDMPAINGLGNASGIVYEVQVNGANRLVVLNTTTGHVGYMGDGSMAISYADGSTGVLSDVQAGDSVSITYENSKIITLLNNTAKPVTKQDIDIKTKGVLADVSSKRLRISGSDDLYVTPDVVVKIDGKTKDMGDLVDAFEDDEDVYVEIEVDNNNDITHITATLESTSDGDEISSISSSSIKVDGKTYDLADEDDLTIDVSDGSSTIDDLDDLIEAVKDDKKVITVTLTEKKSEVTKIKGEVVEVSGTVKNVGSSSIKIETRGDNTYTYNVSSGVDIDVDGDDGMDMDDLKDYFKDEGEFTVDLTLKSNKVTKIED